MWYGVKTKFSWKGAAIQRGLEHRSRGIAIVGAIIRQLLVTTLQAGNDLACPLVICKVWRSAMALQLSIVMRFVKVVNKADLHSKPCLITHTRDKSMRYRPAPIFEIH
jgi:hypothetical protein